MRPAVERLLRESTLTTLVFAIALGWSLYQAAAGIASLITTALDSVDTGEAYLGPLTWKAHGHVFAFAQLIQGLLEFAVVLLVVLLVRRRFPAR